MGVQIALVTHHYPPEIGAPQRRWRQLNARFVAAGHCVTVLTPPPHYPVGRADDLPPDEVPHASARGSGGETIHRVHFRPHGTDLLSRTLDQLRAAVDSVVIGVRRLRGPLRPDVVIATAPGIPSIAAGFVLAQWFRVPFVVEMRDAWPDLIAPSDMWGQLRRKGWRGAATRAAHELVTAGQRHSSAIVTTTVSFADVLRSRGMANVHVVRNGAPLDEAPRVSPPPRHDGLHVLYLGTTGRSQGLLTAVRAAGIAQRDGTPLLLRIVGSGFDDELLRAEAHALGAPVEFVARVPRSEVEALYDWSDTVLVMLRAWDPFEWTVPSKLYEAMVAGRHVSASLSGEAALVVREAGVGDVVPPEDPEALAALWGELAADRSRLEVGDNGRRWVTEHANFDSLAAHYLQILEEVRRPRKATVGQVARNVRLGVTTAAAMLADDPPLLAVQASRRLPRRLTRRLAAMLAAGSRTGAVRAVAARWIGGHRDEAAELLGDARPRGPVARRLVAELAVDLERPDLAPSLPGTTRARAAWRAGDLTLAEGLASSGGAPGLAARYAAELATLRPGFTVPVGRPAAGPARTAGTQPELRPPVALHLLVNSLPHTQSGYALRSHAMLRAQAAAGIGVEGVTRLGYPVSVGQALAAHSENVDGVTYRRLLPTRMPASIVDRATRSLDLLLPLALRLRPTVIHATTPYGNGQIARALAAELHVPWVYEVRGLLEQTWVAGRSGPRARGRAAASERFRLLRAQEAAVASAADHVVTLSATLRDDLLERGVPEDRVTVIPNGVDERLLTLRENAADVRRSLGLPDGGFWVGTVSSLVGYEGLDTLIDAVALLRGRGLDVRACIVGDGISRPELERRAATAGVADAVLLPGRVPADAAIRWHQALDVFVVPRRDVEVCRRVTPLKPVEAMALGRPVVASDLPALSEVLAGGAGVLVPPDDADALADVLAWLHDDPQARAEIGAAGREAAAGRTWSRNGARYRELYSQLGASA